MYKYFIFYSVQSNEWRQAQYIDEGNLIRVLLKFTQTHFHISVFPELFLLVLSFSLLSCSCMFRVASHYLEMNNIIAYYQQLLQHFFLLIRRVPFIILTIIATMLALFLL